MKMRLFDRTPLPELLHRECSAEKLVREMERDMGDWVSAPEAEAEDAAGRVEPEIAALFDRAQSIGHRRGRTVLWYSVPAMVVLIVIGLLIATQVLG